MSLSEKFSKLEDELDGLYMERREQIHGLLLALVAREHVLLLGPPGTAKSAVIGAIIGRIKSARMFERSRVSSLSR